MFRTAVMVSLLSLTGNMSFLAAQSAPSPAPAPDQSFHVRTPAEIAQERAVLLEQAQKAPTGVATTIFENHPTSYTMMAVRVSSGQVELHQHVNDYFVILDGDASVIIGGTIQDGKNTAPGEIRGNKVVGGTEHALHKGDVVYIPAGVPHQTILPKGTVFTYYVVKVNAN